MCLYPFRLENYSGRRGLGGARGGERGGDRNMSARKYEMTLNIPVCAKSEMFEPLVEWSSCGRASAKIAH